MPNPADLSRRDFLRAATATTAGLAALAPAAAHAGTPPPATATNCIVLFLTGGPSQLDTFDPKPDAPLEVRGPFAPIATSVPGVRLSECLPNLAARAHRFALVRSLHHTAAPVHETGQQLLQTGRLGGPDVQHPHFGAVLANVLGPCQTGIQPFVLAPGPIGNTGVSVDHGQGGGALGSRCEPVFSAHAPPSLRAALRPADEPSGTRDRYGATPFGDHCLQARRLIEAGVRCVTVNMFDSVFDRVTWDCHADRRFLNSTLNDYRATLCPAFDAACSALLDDLYERGLLEQTLVLAMGEFGRTPRLNANGGRDHWPRVWSILAAGGGVRGGQVVGASDRLGAEPSVRPVRAEDVAATACHAFGVTPATSAEAAQSCDGQPIRELFGAQA